MKWLRALGERLQHLATAPGEELGRGARFLQFQVRLWHFCLRRLAENNVMAMSAALSFRTIFAMVPTIVLFLLALKAFGLDRGRLYLTELLNRTGLSVIQVAGRPNDANAPASGPAAGAGEAATRPAGPRSINVADEIQKVASQVEEKITFGRLGPVGLALLIWTALTLMTTMERSLNRIFGAPRSRSLARRVLTYWSVLTLGPIALALAGLASGPIVSFFEKVGGVGWVLVVLGWIQPIVIGALVLAGVYLLMPNTKVGIRSALAGAAVAFPLWVLAFWAFSLYVTRVVGGEPLYGSLGLLPLFLLWLNISWMLFLFGAELAHTAGDVGRMAFRDLAERTFMGPWELLGAALAVAERFGSAAGPATLAQVSQRLNLPRAAARELLDRLIQHGTLCRVEHPREEAFVLARAADQIPVSDVLALAGLTRDGKTPIRFHSELARVVQRIRQTAHEALAGITLADLLKER